MDVEAEEEKEEENDDVEEDDVEEEDRSQDRDTHFARACAVELQMNMPHSPFCLELYGTNAVRVSCGTYFARACAVAMHMDISQEPFCIEIYGKSAVRIPRGDTNQKKNGIKKKTKRSKKKDLEKILEATRGTGKGKPYVGWIKK